MFQHDDEYLQATKKAGIYTYEKDKINHTKLIGFNLLLGTLLGGILYIGFSSKIWNTSLFRENKVTQNIDLLSYLNHVEVDTLVDLEKEESQFKLAMAMSKLVSDDTRRDSSYIAELSKELNNVPYRVQKDKNRIITVRKGDTLATLSKKYYGNSMKFEKILASNPQINRESDTIYIGQTLTLPY